MMSPQSSLSITEMSAIVKGNEEREVDNEMGIKRGWRKWGGNIQNRKGNDNNLSWGHKPPFHGYI